MADELLIGVNLEGSQDVEKLNTNLEKTGKAANKASNELTGLRKEIKEAKSEMLKYAEGTAEYNRALTRAAAAQGRIKETNDIVRASVRDLGSTVKMVGGAIGGLTSGFQVAQGAMTLFGIENENTLKVIQNITAAMSVTQGIVQFANGFDDLQDLMTGFRASAAMSSDAVSELSDVSKDVASNLGNVAKEGAVIGSNLAGTQAIVDKTTNSYEKMTMSLEDYMKATVPATSSIKDAEAALLEYQAKTADNEEQIKKVTEELKENSKAQDDLTKSTEKAASGIGKQLLTMGAWIVVIAAVTYAISALIEWLNKIPEDVKIKLELETESLNKLKTDQDKIRKFALDYNKASKEGNKERISELETYAKKEFNVNAERLKAIKTNINGWREAFKEYLDIARKTYYNEALSKKKAESEVNREIAKTQMEITKEQLYKEKGSTSANNIIAGRTTALFGIAAEYKKAVEDFNKANEEVKVLNKTAFIPIDMGTGKVDTGKGSGASSTNKKSLDMQLGLKDVDKQKAVADTFKQENFKLANENLVAYTEEEKVIMEYNTKERKKWYYDSVISEMEYQLKREQARSKDLENEKINTIKQINEQQTLVDSFKDTQTEYDVIASEINSFYNNKAAIQNQNIEFEKKIVDIQNQNSEIQKKSTDKTLVDDQAKIESNNKLINSIKQTIAINVENITSLEKDIESKKEQAVEIVKLLGDLSQTPEKLEELKNKLLAINVEITDATAAQAQIDRDIWAEKLQNFKGYVDAVGKINQSLIGMTEDQMTIIDNKTNKEKNDLELSQTYREADSEKQQQMMYKLELANYNQKKRIFEANKKFQIAGAIITGISGELEAIGNFLKNGGFTNPLAIATLAAETITIGLGTIMTVKKIASTTLDKPIPPSAGGGAGAGSGGANISLNPAKDALTSRDENLNTMAKSNSKNAPASVVKVSEINDVQDRVRVREENASY